jgi:hypothetical protein
MDLIGIGIVATFLSMLVISALAVQVQAPPSEHACTECPLSGKEATLALSWNTAAHRLAIDSCDQKPLAGSRCHETCMDDLRASYPKSPRSTVIG